MDKIISFGKGIRRQPSIGEDGELSELVNLIPKNGELVNIMKMQTSEDLPPLSEGERFVKVHQVQGADNYLVLSKSGDSHYLKYYRKGSEDWDSKTYNSKSLSADSTVEVIGNTLMVLSGEAMYYYLWKGEEGYAYLGDHLPELPISFGLQGQMIRTGEYYFSADSDKNGDELFAFDDDKQSFTIKKKYHEALTNKVLGEVNEFIRDKATNQGKFIFPFFVRYAYRLYDGTLTMHSAPALMVCSSGSTLQCYTGFTKREGDPDNYYYVFQLNYRIAAMLHQLDYAVMGATTLDRIEPWKDIVKSVDVFVSSPIYTYDQNGECTVVDKTLDHDSYCICKNVGQQASTETYPLRYQKSDLSYLYAMTFAPDTFTTPLYSVRLPYRDDQAIKRDIAENSLFYHLTSIGIDDLKNERTLLPISKEYLQSLTSREVMTDDYMSHDTLIPRRAYAYNARLNLFDVKRTLFGGFRNDTMQSYSDGYVYRWADSDPTAVDYTLGVDVYYHIRQDGKEFVVWNNDGSIGNHAPFLWLYHPNRNVYQATIEISRAGAKTRYNVKMEPHPFLGGSYYFAGWDGLKESDETSTIPILTNDASVAIENTIFSSDVNNPFHFSALGSYAVGAGRILGVSTAAKALSQGQFGQFPLYAFCDDGIWALEVSSDGTFSAKQPISRDVCTNVDSITQIDDAVVFATSQGLKLIQGSEVVLLSDPMNGHNVDESDYFPEGFFGGFGLSDFDDLVKTETRDFRDILSTCKIAYDYPNRLLRIFPEGGGKWYVYSLDTREYASEERIGDVESVVPGYPTPLVQVGTTLYSFRSGVDDELRNGLLLTRPIDMGEPFALKKIHDMKLHYTKHNKDDGTFVKMVVYFSNDGVNWDIMRSLRKRAYKYYRLALITKMKGEDRLSGMIMRYELERTNKLR